MSAENRAVKFVYHGVPRDLIGDVIYPLNRPHSVSRTRAWRGVGSERTVCRVTTTGWVSAAASERM